MSSIWLLYNWPTTHLPFMSRYWVFTLHVFTTVLKLKEVANDKIIYILGHNVGHLIHSVHVNKQ